MKIEEKEYYLNGIMNMASSISKNIGLSYIDVEAYNKETFNEDFCKYHKIKEIELENLNISLTEALKEWFYEEDKLIESIIYWINYNIGKEKTIYTPESKIIEKLSTSNKGISKFYKVEDIFIIEYEKEIIVFILGNNE